MLLSRDILATKASGIEGFQLWAGVQLLKSDKGQRFKWWCLGIGYRKEKETRKESMTMRTVDRSSMTSWASELTDKNEKENK